MSLELNQNLKPPPSQQDNDLWISMAQAEYPGISLSECRILRDEVVMEWALGGSSKKAELYDKYHVVKSLKQS